MKYDTFIEALNDLIGPNAEFSIERKGDTWTINILQDEPEFHPYRMIDIKGKDLEHVLQVAIERLHDCDCSGCRDHRIEPAL